MSTSMPELRSVDRLSAPETRRFLSDFVKRRVANDHVDDVVQTVLVSALEARNVPDSEPELRRWLTGIAKHKIADLHRKSGREQPRELPDVEVGPPPVEERFMVEWAEKQAARSKDAKRTLEWMAREGEGEKLEQIAADEKVEPATVRQRVSRMRRWMKERWVAELAAVAMLAVIGFVVWSFLRTRPAEIVRETPSSAPVPSAPLSPQPEADKIRRAALDACERREFETCLEGLDRAKALDSAGDDTPSVQSARDEAKRALERRPKSAPAPSASSPVTAVPPQETAAPPTPAPSTLSTPVKPTGPDTSTKKPTPTKSTPIESFGTPSGIPGSKAGSTKNFGTPPSL